MVFYRRDIIQMFRDENDLLKTRNKQVGDRLVYLQQAFRVLNTIDTKTHTLTEAPDIEEFFHQLLELVLHTCNTENGSLIMLDDKTQEALAHRFAGAFIVPADVARAELGEKRRHHMNRQVHAKGLDDSRAFDGVMRRAIREQLEERGFRSADEP